MNWNLVTIRSEERAGNELEWKKRMERKQQHELITYQCLHKVSSTI